MAKATRATQVLTQACVTFEVHSYAYAPGAERIGMQAAEALRVPPGRVLKTLMALVDGRSVCAILQSDREMSLKRLAVAFGGKSAEMMQPARAERLTGYVVGGISPFGQRQSSPTVIEETALGYDTVFLNAGQRGLQFEMSPRDAVIILEALVRALVA